MHTALKEQAHKLLTLEEGMPLVKQLLASAEQMQQQAKQGMKVSSRYSDEMEEYSDMEMAGFMLRLVAAAFCQEAVKWRGTDPSVTCGMTRALNPLT